MSSSEESPSAPPAAAAPEEEAPATAPAAAGNATAASGRSTTSAVADDEAPAAAAAAPPSLAPSLNRVGPGNFSSSDSEDDDADDVDDGVGDLRLRLDFCRRLLSDSLSLPLSERLLPLRRRERRSRSLSLSRRDRLSSRLEPRRLRSRLSSLLPLVLRLLLLRFPSRRLLCFELSRRPRDGELREDEAGEGLRRASRRVSLPRCSAAPAAASRAEVALPPARRSSGLAERERLGLRAQMKGMGFANRC